MKHVGTQEIKTERLLLRRFKETDADMMFNNWANDDEVTRYMRWQSYKSANEAVSTLKSWVDSYESESYYHWGLCLDKGEMIGSLGVYIDSEHDQRAGLGYCIGRKWWGQGFTSEALKAVIDYIFTNTDVERIEAFHAVENPASGKVMLNAGMEFEGFARHKFKSRVGFEDSNNYSIVREMWEVQKEIVYYNALPAVFEDFIEVPELSDGVISIKCMVKIPANPEEKFVPSYLFDIRKDNEIIGNVNLRIGYSNRLYYGGQIAYCVNEDFRGNGYAARACRLLLPVAKAHGMEKLLITNNHTNTASMRVCEKLGARLIRTVWLPEWHDLYKEGQRYQNIYEWNIE